MAPPGAQAAGLDLLRLPLLGSFLRWRHARVAFQLPMLAIAALLIFDGLFGPQLAPMNLAGVVPWVEWRGLTVLALLQVGSVACTVCPFMLPRWLAKRLLPAERAWPRALRWKWPAVALLLLFFWYYEAFDPWASPWLTAVIILVYFAAAFVVDAFFKGAAFCKYLCPIGQFNFVNSLVSPSEVRVLRPNLCSACATKDCIRQPGGCELGLFQPKKAGNMDCTFCLDCVHACPHDNVGVILRRPGAELGDGRHRAGLGHLDERVDLAALVVVLVYASYMNAFGMVGPFHGFAGWVAGLLGTRSEGIVLLVVFALGLGVLPLATVGLAAWASRKLAGSTEPLARVAAHHSYGLLPLGFGMWLAHYGYHFLTGGLTLVPVVQSFLADAGLPLLGDPAWGLAPLVPASWLLPIELICLEAGLLLSLVVSHRLARSRQGELRAARRAFLPWALLEIALFAAGVWLMLQPMEMRGTLGVG